MGKQRDREGGRGRIVAGLELIEMITHLAFYVGWPSAMSAVTHAKELFATKPERS